MIVNNNKIINNLKFESITWIPFIIVYDIYPLSTCDMASSVLTDDWITLD